MKVDIFDSEGNSIGLESFAKGNFAGVRALPEKTATYFIRVVTQYDPEKAKSDEAREAVEGVGDYEGMVDWGLVYGYR